MESSKKISPIINGIRTLSIIVINLLLSTYTVAFDNNYQPPHPMGSFFLRLIQKPSPPLLSVYPIPVQEAVVNRDFKINLKKYIKSSSPEIIYKLENRFYNVKGAMQISGRILAVLKLPIGLLQISNRVGDCYPHTYLYTGQDCLLRFYADPERYTSTAYDSGPLVLTRLSWIWDTVHQSTEDYQLTPLTYERIIDIMPPALLPIQGIVIPDEQDGLRFDKETLSIVGKPQRTGIYVFNFSATNGKSTAASSELQITVSINSKDKPVFKSNYLVASAMPNKEYRLDLMDLIETTEGFGKTNQVTFRIEKNKKKPDWLSLNSNLTVLYGTVPKNAAGQMVAVSLIATSNTGGDSQLTTIQIPVAFNLENKPRIDPGIELASSAGNFIRHDFRNNISCPFEDNGLKIIISSIKPKAPWLKIDPSNPTELIGEVPENAVGKSYRIILHANSTTGGDSDSVIVALKITSD